MPADFTALCWIEVIRKMEDAILIAHLIVWGCRWVESRSLESCCGHFDMFFQDLEKRRTLWDTSGKAGYG